MNLIHGDRLITIVLASNVSGDHGSLGNVTTIGTASCKSPTASGSNMYRENWSISKN
jgi:hypothetical protein